MQDEDKDAAKKFLLNTVAQVQRAKSFEATIVHEDSNGLYPGRFTQKLRWQEKVGFDLVVVDRGTAPATLPNYFCRDGRVVSQFRDMRRTVQSAKPEPNTTPSWEVTGGLNLTFINQSPLLDALFAEPKPIKSSDKLQIPPDAKVPEIPVLTYRFGEARRWQGQSAKEIVASVGGDNPYTFSIFVHPTGRYVLGMEASKKDGGVGRMEYKDIKVNGEMPSDLGVAPGG